MNLDDHILFSKLDPHNLLNDIEKLPDQLAESWNFGLSLELPDWSGVERVVIAGMGSSAIAAELLSVHIAPVCQVPVTVVRNYELPAWAKGSRTLVICSSYSGNTEEVIGIFNQAVDNGCLVLTISTGGKLSDEAQKLGAESWIFQHQGIVGAAIGYAFVLPLVALFRLGLTPNLAQELKETIAAMKLQQVTLGADVPLIKNEAKRLAGQSVGRSIMVIGSDHLFPVARYWKIQINEVAKTWAHFEEIPEMNHNTLTGVINPSNYIPHSMLMFLRARDSHPRNQLRTNITKEFFMLEGFGTDFFNAPGETRLAQMWTSLHFGDYLAYYLAISYGVDPGPVDAVDGFKDYLKNAE